MAAVVQSARAAGPITQPNEASATMKPRLRTRTSYGIACAAVWAVILIITQIDCATPHTQNTFWLSSLGLWIGSLSATITRAAATRLCARSVLDLPPARRGYAVDICCREPSVIANGGSAVLG